MKNNYPPFSSLLMLILGASMAITKCHFCCYLTGLITLKYYVICMEIEILACHKRAHLIAAVCVYGQKKNS